MLSAVFLRRAADPAPECFAEGALAGKAEQESDLADRQSAVADMLQRNLASRFVEQRAVRRARFSEATPECGRAHVQLARRLRDVQVPLIQSFHEQLPNFGFDAVGLRQLLEQALSLALERAS
jgi:hypothetical protein